MGLNSKRIILGTANLCTIYGNKAKFIKKDQAKKILKFAYQNKIRTLDISPSYKFFKFLKDERRLDSWNYSLKISSKDFKKIKNNNELEIYLKKKTEELRIKKIQYLLFHDVKNLLSKKGRKLFNHLSIIKKKHNINKIGVSVYTNKELMQLVKKKYDLQVIQAPFNIFDQRLNNPKVIKTLKKKGVEIHVRSIFLQGILADKKLIDKKFKRFIEIRKFYKYLNEKKLDSLNFTLSLLDKNKFIDKILIGVRSVKQLKEIINANLYKRNQNFSKFKSNNLKLIDPRKW